MEGNRDGAAECLNRAQAYLSQNNLERAKGLAEKANRMYPSERASTMLQRIATLSSQSSATGAAAGSSDGVRQRRTPAGSASGSASTSSSAAHAKAKPEKKKATATPLTRKYTSEQFDSAQRVLLAKSHYEVLGVERSSDAASIKKVYRKLAMKLHPDKNPAPNAAAAFKAVGSAYEILSDTTRRRHYDLTGRDEPTTAARGPRYRQDLTPEEIFAQVFGARFGGGFPRQEFHGGRRPRHRHEAAGEHVHAGGNGQLQLLMMLLVLFFTFVLPAFLPQEEALFSFTRKAPYVHEMSVTQIPDVKYYITTDFRNAYPETTVAGRHKLQKVEYQVLQSYLRHLESNCEIERRKRQTAIRRAHYRNAGPEEKDRAYNLGTPSCDRVNELFNSSGAFRRRP